MTNSRASSGGQIELLDYHIATGTEATYTVTKDMNLKTKYSEIIVVIAGKLTATAAIDLIFEAVTTAYYSSVRNNVAGTITGVDEANAAQITLASTTILDGAHRFQIIVHITWSEGTTYDVHFTAAKGNDNSVGSGTQGAATDAGALAAFTIATSTSTWIADTQITTYGVKLT